MNQINIMENENNKNNAGRKLGSKNNINQSLKKEFTELILEHFKKEVRNFPVMDYEPRMRLLIMMLPYVLPKANLTKEESEIQKLLIEKITPEFRKFSSYLNVIPSDKKAQILLNLVKQLNPTSSQQEKILNTLK